MGNVVYPGLHMYYITFSDVHLADLKGLKSDLLNQKPHAGVWKWTYCRKLPSLTLSNGERTNWAVLHKVSEDMHWQLNWEKKGLSLQLAVRRVQRNAGISFLLKTVIREPSQCKCPWKQGELLDSVARCSERSVQELGTTPSSSSSFRYQMEKCANVVLAQVLDGRQETFHVSTLAWGICCPSVPWVKEEGMAFHNISVCPIHSLPPLNQTLCKIKLSSNQSFAMSVKRDTWRSDWGEASW